MDGYTVLTYSKGGQIFKMSASTHIPEYKLVNYCRGQGLVYLRHVYRISGIYN